MVDGKKIAFGVDSFEDFKMWYEEDFIKLADLLYEKKLFDYIYLICGPDKSHIAKKIKNDSKREYFIDCSNKDLQGVILAIKNSDFYVGNNSGPLNLSAALGKITWLLLQRVPDWRWGYEGNSTFWYPSIRIYRQEKFNDWTLVMKTIANELSQFIIQ